LYIAIDTHKTAMAKKGCQKEILAVFPINPQVAKDITMITHQGKNSCNTKAIIKTTIKTMSYFFEIL
jgi:hypothetical protein